MKLEDSRLLTDKVIEYQDPGISITPLFSKNWRTLTTTLTKYEEKSVLVQNSTQKATKVAQYSTKNETKIVQKSTEKETKIVQNSTKKEAKITQNSTKKEVKVVQHSMEKEVKIVQNINSEGAIQKVNFGIISFRITQP